MSIKPLDWLELLPPNIQTPCFVVDEERLLANLEILDSVQKRTGAKILLALKGFAMFSVFGLLNKTLCGTCASSPHEARLGKEEFGREVHAFAAAYSQSDICELVPLVDHLVFNSFAQYQHFRPLVESLAAGKSIEFGLRINPEHSEGAVDIYNPCSSGSRLGIRLKDFSEQSLEGISGLHFHTLCEQDALPLKRTLEVVEGKFGKFLHQMQWLNFGGGHHITKEDYGIDLLCSCISKMQEKYGVQVYLEPGEAVALNTGVLVSTVLDVVEADMPIALLDTSAAAHMPDVLEMPYRPNIIDAGLPDAKKWTCRLAGKSCLAGDVIGEYSFDKKLQRGDKLIFLDMAHYSMVKTTTFNGLKLPDIAIIRQGSHHFEIVRRFGYEDFKTRLS